MKRFRCWRHRRAELRANAAHTGASITVRVRDDEVLGPLIPGPLHYYTVLDLPRPLRRRVLAELSDYYTLHDLWDKD